MRLDLSDAGYFILRAARGEVDPQEIMGTHGLDFSPSASYQTGEHIFFTQTPYAVAPFAGIADTTAAVFDALRPMLRRIEASRALDSNRNLTVPDDKELWAFQKASTSYALDTLAAGRGCLVADEPGLGKTEIANVIANEIQALRVLLICPACIRQQWAARVRLWSTIPRPMVATITSSRHGIPPSCHWHWTITSFELARHKAIHAALMLEEYDLLIIDEAHYLKTSNSGRAAAILGDSGLITRAAHTVALTGTPSPNRPAELFTLIKSLAWDAIDWMTEHAFQNRYNQRIDDVTADGRPFIRDVQGRHPELQARLRGNIMTRHLKREVMTQLKRPIYDLVQAEETGPVKQALMAESLSGIDPDNLTGADAEMLGHVAALRKQMGLAIAPQVVDYCKTLYEGGEHKLVVFAWHIEVLDIIEAGLAKYGVARVDGRTTSAQKSERVRRFCEDPAVGFILGNTLTLGTGTDGLQHVADHCVIAEPDWVPGNNQQCADRLDRGGQRNTVQVDIVVAPGSIAEKVLANALRKMPSISATLDERFS